MSLLGQIVAGEARTPLGQQAVLNVLQNRAASNYGGYGSTLLAQATAPLQFSAYPNALGSPSAITEQYVSAAGEGTLGNVVPNAVNYANPTVGNTSSVNWVSSAMAKGLGVNVNGEGNVFWGPNGSDPGYDPTQAGVNPVSAGPDPLASNDAAGGGFGSTWQSDTGMGSDVAGTNMGYPAYDVAGSSSSDSSGLVSSVTTASTTQAPVSGDLTQYQVAGVNAPAGAAVTQGASPTVAGADQTSQAGQPIYETNAAQVGAAGEQAVAKSVQGAGQAVQSAEGNLAAAGTSWLGSIFSGVTSLFVRSSFVLIGFVLILGAFLFFYAERQESGVAAHV